MLWRRRSTSVFEEHAAQQSVLRHGQLWAPTNGSRMRIALTPTNPSKACAFPHLGQPCSCVDMEQPTSVDVLLPANPA